MKRKALALTLVMSLAFSYLFCGILVQPVRSQFLGSVYINSDGSVTGTDKIQRNVNVYTLTGNISGGIQVRVSYVVIDGAGYTVQGNGSLGSRGIDLSNNRGSDPSRYEISNVTVKNRRIINFDRGIENVNTSNNTIVGNYIADCSMGINIMGSPNNVLIKNNTIANNFGIGVAMAYSGGNQIITEDNIINNSVSVWLSPEPSVDGNYWSDYLTKYPNAKEIDNLGIWNTPYDYGGSLGNFTDDHPLVRPVSNQWLPEIPVISILSPANTTYAAVYDPCITVPLTFTTNAALSWVGYSLDSGSNVTVTNRTLIEIPHESRRLTLYANDTAGNWATPQTVYYSIAFNLGYPPAELFPTALLVASVALVAAVGAGLLVYVKKRGRGRNS